MHAARAGKIERVRRRRAHGDARTHDAHARKRGDITVDGQRGSHIMMLYI